MEKQPFIPEYILENYSKSSKSGSFEAGILFFDIVSFTQLTEHLMHKGNEGVEILSNIINDIYKPVIQAIYKNGGFVASFAGDAFTAVFPKSNVGALIASKKIREIIENSDTLDELPEEFTQIKAKQSISYGEVQWGILGNDLLIPYFRSASIQNTANMQKFARPNDILIDGSATEILSKYIIIKPVSQGNDIFFIQDINIPKTISMAVAPLAYTYDNDINSFTPQIMQEAKLKNEFRRVDSIFINFADIDKHDELNTFISELLILCHTYGAYFSGLDFSDKGNVAIILFGLPISYEQMEVRTMELVTELMTKYHSKVKVGVSSGDAFAGVIGSDTRACYTAIGDSINLAARLMENSNYGQSLFSEEIVKKVKKQYKFNAPVSISVKGKKDNVLSFLLEGSKITSAKAAFDSPYVDAGNQLEKIIEHFKPLSNGEFAGIYCLFGTAGTGKSRLANKVIQKVKNRNVQLKAGYLQSDSILKKSLNPFSYYFRNMFAEIFVNPLENKKEAFEKIIFDFIKTIPQGDEQILNICNDLERRSSCIASLIGVFWPGSFFHILDAQAKAENIFLAVIDYFKLLSYKNPVLLLFEDAHALDEDSTALLKNLLQSLQPYSFGVILNARSQDDDTLPFIVYDTDYEYSIVKPLTKKNMISLLKQLAKSEPGQKLIDFMFEKTLGNPLFLEQLYFFLREKKAIINDGEKITLQNIPNDLPDGISSFLVSRIDRLSIDLKEMVQVSSVLGTIVQTSLLERLLDKSLETLEGTIEEGVKEKVWTRSTDLELTFDSELLRQAAYNMQLPGDLKELHRVSAESMQEVHYNVPLYFADIAYHFKKANDKRAKDSYYQAARFAKTTYKNYKALEFFEEILLFKPAEDEILNINYEIAEVLETIGQWQDALKLLRDSADLAILDNLFDLRVKIDIKSAEIHQKQSKYYDALELLENSIEILVTRKRTNEEDILLGDAFQWVGRTLWSLGNYNDSLLAYYKSLVQYRKRNSQKGQGLSLYYMGVDYRDKGDHAKAMEYYLESQSIFEKLGNKRFLTYPLYDIALLYQFKGQMQKSRESFIKVYDSNQEIGYRSGLSAALLNLGKIQEQEGNFDDALQKYEESYGIVEELNEKLAIAYTLFSIFVIHYHKNDPLKSLQYARNALTIMVQIGARGYYGYVLSYLACYYVKNNKFQTAIKTCWRHFKNVNKTGSDVEHGRTHLAVARVLSKIKDIKKIKGIEKYLNKIHELSGLQPTAEDYFLKAIEISEKANYVNTLIPALRSYTEFLLQILRIEDAEKICIQAEGLAKSKGFLLELKKIVQLKENLNKTRKINQK